MIAARVVQNGSTPPKALMSANTPGAMAVRALLGYIFRNQRADSTTQRLRMWAHTRRGQVHLGFLISLVRMRSIQCGHCR